MVILPAVTPAKDAIRIAGLRIDMRHANARKFMPLLCEAPNFVSHRPKSCVAARLQADEDEETDREDAAETTASGSLEEAGGDDASGDNAAGACAHPLHELFSVAF